MKMKKYRGMLSSAPLNQHLTPTITTVVGAPAHPHPIPPEIIVDWFDSEALTMQLSTKQIQSLFSALLCSLKPPIDTHLTTVVHPARPTPIIGRNTHVQLWTTINKKVSLLKSHLGSLWDIQACWTKCRKGL